ncbi:hypothetical protein TrLO_g7962 [Triparma laevis f. longispina]|uniref:PH domain-containing protein n=1 Tax=Triparma laevis f. longispina TaxID=1714387 RepID=A0A9W7FJK0_9STRA|nr:hypothetical protein TrLO_g7962 [Triparma laevis f. longispina]
MGQEISKCVEDMTGAMDTDITEQSNKEDGEVAAGFLFQRPSRSKLAGLKKAAGASRSMKRAWYVLRGWPDCTLTTYKDRFSPTPTGVIHLLKCDVKAKPAEDDKYHFQIHHSSHGSRHLFAENSHLMHRWITEITNVVEESSSMGGMEGNLKKRGGIRLHTWQSRWFMLMGSDLAWYEKPTDSFPRGEITLGSQVIAKNCDKPVGGEKYVFEIIDSARHDFKRRREFACETSLDRKYWVEQIQISIKSQKAALSKHQMKRSASRSSTISRSTLGEESDEEGEGGGRINSSEVKEGEEGWNLTKSINNIFRSTDNDMVDVMHFPEPKTGAMQKHSSYLVWQTKFFECKDGELKYWKNETAHENQKPESAVIRLSELQRGSPSSNPVDRANILLATDTGKVYSFRCKSEEDANDWLNNINEWQRFLNMKD